MKQFSLIAVLVALAIASASATRFSFEDYKVWSIGPFSDAAQQADLLQFRDHEHVDFWDEPTTVGDAIRVMVAPVMQTQFVEYLRSQRIANELIIENVERTLEAERQDDADYRRQIARQRFGTGGRLVSDFNHFWHLDEIEQYLVELVRLHPNLTSTEVLGRSSEGRPLRIVNISLRGSGIITGERPIVFIDAGIHAREWAAHHAGLYILKQLVENHHQYHHILESVDFVVLPVVNPDGYVYSRDVYRFWRKTRAAFPVNEIGLVCYGTDGNRNYPHMWRSAQQTRVTTCNETYPGPEPFSEPETRAVQTVIDRHSTDIKLYVSLHTYGNYVLYPWGYERTLIENWAHHHRIGRLFADTIRLGTGTNYRVYNSAIGLYPAYGGSDDYAAFAGVQLAYTYELTGGGRFGFDLPANRLQAVLDELWLGFEPVLQYVGEHDWDEYTLE